MKRVLFFIAASVCFFCFAGTTLANQKFVEGELLVKYKNGTASRAASAINSRIGSRLLEEFPEIGWQRVRLPRYLSVSQAVSRYENEAEIEAVQPNYIYNLLAVPNDTRFSELYGMQKISAPLAWDLTTGNPEVVVAVIDTGVKYTHEDLAANMWTNPGEINGNGIDDDNNGFVDDYYGYDFFFNDSNPDDEHGHGTHVAGTIGVVGNNNLGVAGVNWNVRMMAIKIYNSTGNGSTSAMIINAYNYVRMMKNRGVNIRLTNNSYGGCDEACGYDQATKDAIDALGEANVLQVFAAGNNNRNIETNPFYPASYNTPMILSVASSDQNDNRSGFSNHGTTSVDLAAPGSGILSTVRTTANYGMMSGTSMASPHVAGAAALLAAYNPNLSAASLKATLMNTVDPLAQWSSFVKTSGRLNALKTLQNQTVCNFSLSQNSIFVPDLSGGNFSVNVTAPANCDYSAISNADWITVKAGNPGSGSSTVAFTVAANNGLYRTGTIKIAGLIFSVTQHGGDPALRQYLDFDGDGKTDFSAIQNGSGNMIWHNYRSTSGYSATNFGLFSEDIPVLADFDGDLKTDVAVWRGGNAGEQAHFYVLRSADTTLQSVAFGFGGDNPNLTQDFDGDGRADFTVIRTEDGKLVWHSLLSAGGTRSVQFGLAGDKAVRGDYDADGKADPAVYRGGAWYVLQSSAGFTSANFGIASDKPVPGDYDGDGKTDIAVFRDGAWYYLKSSDGSFAAYQFGTSGDLPTPGDYDGDGRTDFSVWRANQTANEAGIFYIQASTSGFSAFGWGNSAMKIPANSLLGQ